MINDQGLGELIKQLPKTETHLHIEGALKWELLQELHPEKYTEPPLSWQEEFKFRDFAHFEGELLSYAGDFYTSADRYHQSAKAVFADHVANNVKYVETSFASGCIEFFKLDAREVLDAILAAVPEGLEVRVFMGIHHDGYTEIMTPVIDAALNWDGLAGIDLHGAEDVPLGDWAKDLYRRARDNGKFTKAHAGEFMGADFVRFAVEELGAQRIEHGVRACEDPELLPILRERGIALDICPISNIKLGVAENIETHPIRRLHNAGVICTVSTDDPISFGNNLDDEYLLLAKDEQFIYSELAQLAKNGFMVSLWDSDAKDSWIAKLDTIISQNG